MKEPAKPTAPGRWVEFVADFTFQPAAEPRGSIRYRAGMVIRVTKECADKAIGRKKAVPASAPRRQADDHVGG